MWLKNVSKVAPIKEAFKCFLSFIFAAVEPGRSSSSSRFFASTVFRNSSVVAIGVQMNFKMQQLQLEKQPTRLHQVRRYQITALSKVSDNALK